MSASGPSGPLVCLLMIVFKIYIQNTCMYSKKFSGIPSRVSNSLDPDQTRHYVRSDLGPDSLQRLLVQQKTSRQRAQ